MSTGQAVVEVIDNKKVMRQSAFQEVEKAKAKAELIIVHDEHSAQIAQVFISEMRDLSDLLESLRDSEVRPLNETVKGINDDYRPYKELCKALDTRMDEQVKAYREHQRQEAARRQQEAIEEAKRKKAEEEAKAAELRRQAEEAKRKEEVEAKATQEQDALHASLADIEARKEAAIANEDHDVVMVLEKQQTEIQDKLEALPTNAVTETRESLQKALFEIQTTKAIARANGDEDELVVLDAKEKKLSEQIAQLSTELTVVDLESQAQEAEFKAATVAPAVIQQVQKTVVLPTGKKMSYTTQKVPVCLPGGLPVDGEYYRDDPRIKALPDHIFQYNAKRLRALVKAGVVVPGVEVKEEEISRRR